MIITLINEMLLGQMSVYHIIMEQMLLGQMSVYHIITEQKLLVQLPIEQKLKRQIQEEFLF